MTSSSLADPQLDNNQKHRTTNASLPSSSNTTNPVNIVSVSSSKNHDSSSAHGNSGTEIHAPGSPSWNNPSPTFSVSSDMLDDPPRVCLTANASPSFNHSHSVSPMIIDASAVHAKQNTLSHQTHQKMLWLSNNSSSALIDRSSNSSEEDMLTSVNTISTTASMASSSELKRTRKSSMPVRAPSNKESAAESVVFKFVLSEDSSTQIEMTNRPDELLARCIRRRRAARLSGSEMNSACRVALMNSPYASAFRKRRPRYQDVQNRMVVTGLGSTMEYDEEEGFPTSELFYHAFAENPVDAAIQHGNRRINSSGRFGFDQQYQDLPFYGDDYDDEYDEDSLLTPPLTPKAKKKKKPPVKKPRSKTAKIHAEKVCMSCKTNQTPIWREVKEAWGDGWEDILLCNACGLQWRMAGLRCSNCNYVPRASEKRVKKCTKCDVGYWYRKG